MRCRFVVPTVLMIRLPLLSKIALGSALVLGCADQQTLSGPADVSGPSFRTDQNPEGPGAIVIRSQVGGFLTISDPDPGLTASIGSTFAELEHFCATGEFPARRKEIAVIRPHSTDELLDLHIVQHGTRLPLLVWEATIPFIDPIGELCGELLPLPHLTGTGNITNTDNDVFTTGSRGNTGGFRLQGQVTSDGGERFKFLGKFHGLITKSGHQRFTFDLDLRPIGGG